jgi:hypothetical protein
LKKKNPLQYRSLIEKSSLKKSFLKQSSPNIFFLPKVKNEMVLSKVALALTKIALESSNENFSAEQWRGILFIGEYVMSGEVLIGDF